MGRLTIAALGVLLAFCWQFATVTLNYGGNWTALYCTGDHRPVPLALEGEEIYVFPDTSGFDGQFYHYIAHQPIPGDLYDHVEAGRLRYRRILVPAMAYLLSFGRQDLVDAAYLVSGHLFLFLGIWWMGGLTSAAGLHRAWALLFLAVPASLIFVDRLTVDHALAAFTVAFVLYVSRHSSWKLYTVLALAPLARELGLLLIAAYCAVCLFRRQWRLVAIFSTTAVPWFLWTGWLAATKGSDSFPTSLVPLGNLLHWLFHPPTYPTDIPLAGLVRAGDALALLGMLAAITLAAWLFVKRYFDPVAVAAVLFALLTVFLQRDDIWQTVYNYGRIFSPLLVLVLAGWLPQRRWLAVMPLALVLPRVLMQFGRQVMGIAESIFG
jgi:hypothetical protein